MEDYNGGVFRKNWNIVKGKKWYYFFDFLQDKWFLMLSLDLSKFLVLKNSKCMQINHYFIPYVNFIVCLTSGCKVLATGHPWAVS